jgi:hypothetical protein
MAADGRRRLRRPRAVPYRHEYVARNRRASAASKSTAVDTRPGQAAIIGSTEELTESILAAAEF